MELILLRDTCDMYTTNTVNVFSITLRCPIVFDLSYASTSTLAFFLFLSHLYSKESFTVSLHATPSPTPHGCCCLMYCFMLAHACNLCMYLIVDWNVIMTATILLLGAYSVMHAATYTIVQLQRVVRVCLVLTIASMVRGHKGRS